MKTYHIITYGCQMNESDSEQIATHLEKKGYRSADLEKADLIVLNACSVRQSAINRLNSKIQKIAVWRPKRKIILTGCLLEKDKERLKNQVDEIWSIADFSHQKTKYQCGENALVPIMNGCNNFCSYCVVPHTRGREISRPAKDILKEIRCLTKKDCREIVLLGQNVNSYQDKEINFPRLLETVCRIPGDFMIKFLTSHPKDMSNELIDLIAREPKIAKEIHLPVQSGNTAILKKMNRQYAIGHYKKLVQEIRKKIPTVKLSTDVIVGFPGETEKQFQDTVNLIKKIKYHQIYVASYSPRSQTAAFQLKDNVSSFEKKRRKKVLLNLPREK